MQLIAIRRTNLLSCPYKVVNKKFPYYKFAICGVTAMSLPIVISTRLCTFETRSRTIDAEIVCVCVYDEQMCGMQTVNKQKQKKKGKTMAKNQFAYK